MIRGKKFTVILADELANDATVKMRLHYALARALASYGLRCLSQEEVRPKARARKAARAVDAGGKLG